MLEAGPGSQNTLGAAAGPAHHMGSVEGHRTVYVGDCADLVHAEVFVGSLADYWRAGLSHIDWIGDSGGAPWVC